MVYVLPRVLGISIKGDLVWARYNTVLGFGVHADDINPASRLHYTTFYYIIIYYTILHWEGSIIYYTILHWEGFGPLDEPGLLQGELKPVAARHPVASPDKEATMMSGAQGGHAWRKQHIMYKHE